MSSVAYMSYVAHGPLVYCDNNNLCTWVCLLLHTQTLVDYYTIHVYMEDNK